MAILVIPLHLMDLLKVSSLVEEGASLTCQIRLFFHLFVICVRSWSTPSFILLHHLHDGIIPTKHSVSLITFIWIISALFVLPTVLVENSLVDFQACQLLPQNYGMVFYVVFLIFGLPSIIVTPIFIRSTKLRWVRIKKKWKMKKKFKDHNFQERIQYQTRHLSRFPRQRRWRRSRRNSSDENPQTK